MPAPFDFPAATVNVGLPLLFTGQAQREFFVNEALSLVDALLPHSVVSSTSTPPAGAENGEAYRIIGPATGDWTGEEDSLAVMVGGAWRFVAPVDGLSMFDQSAGQILVFRGQWEASSAPAEPTGGTVVDAEARSAISALLAELNRLGILV